MKFQMLFYHCICLYISQKITKSEALTKMQNSNEMLSLEGINSKSDAEEWLDSIHINNTLVETANA